MISEDTSLRDKVMDNAQYFRTQMKVKGFDIPDGDAAIVPVMLYDALYHKNGRKTNGRRHLCYRIFLPCGLERQG